MDKSGRPPSSHSTGLNILILPFYVLCAVLFKAHKIRTKVLTRFPSIPLLGREEERSDLLSPPLSHSQDENWLMFSFFSSLHSSLYFTQSTGSYVDPPATGLSLNLSACRPRHLIKANSSGPFLCISNCGLFYPFVTMNVCVCARARVVRVWVEVIRSPLISSESFAGTECLAGTRRGM